jgi:hypothetical protein
MHIDEFIEDQTQQVKSTDLRVLESFSGRLLDKLKEGNIQAYTSTRDRETDRSYTGGWPNLFDLAADNGS